MDRETIMYSTNEIMEFDQSKALIIAVHIHAFGHFQMEQTAEKHIKRTSYFNETITKASSI